MKKQQIINQFKFKPIIASLLFGLVLSPLYAGSTTATLNVSATIPGDSCSIIVENMNFGSYTGTALSAVSNMAVDCGGEAIAWDILINVEPAARTMTGANTGSSLTYDIYREAAHTTIFDDSTGLHPFATGDLVSTPMFYGLIPAGQAAPADSYSDTISIQFIF